MEWHSGWWGIKGSDDTLTTGQVVELLRADGIEADHKSVRAAVAAAGLTLDAWHGAWRYTAEDVEAVRAFARGTVGTRRAQ